MSELLPTDEISRCIIYPRFFEGQFHTDKVLWKFESKAPDNTYHESGVLRRIAVNDDDVHRNGCRIASNQNKNIPKPIPPGKQKYYCGFRTGVYGNLELEDDDYRIDITLLPEDGEAAHLDIRLTLVPKTSSARNTAKLAAGMAMADHFGPAHTHRCECDLNDANHPFALYGEDCLNRELPFAMKEAPLPVASANDEPSALARGSA